MEYWQREIIMKNLPRLSMNTNVSTVFLAIFVSKNILSRADIELLNAQTRTEGKTYTFYGILQTRKDSFEVLLEALRETNQSGAYSILIEAQNLHKEALQNERPGIKEGEESEPRADVLPENRQESSEKTNKQKDSSIFIKGPSGFEDFLENAEIKTIFIGTLDTLLTVSKIRSTVSVRDIHEQQISMWNSIKLFFTPFPNTSQNEFPLMIFHDNNQNDSTKKKFFKDTILKILKQISDVKNVTAVFVLRKDHEVLESYVTSSPKHTEHVAVLMDEFLWQDLTKEWQKELLARDIFDQANQKSLMEFCNSFKYEDQTKFKESFLNGQLLVDLINNKKIPILIRQTIPPVGCYIDRKLRSRFNISKSIFQKTHPNDIFVFENFKSMDDLRYFAKPCTSTIDTANGQIDRGSLTAGFILAEHQKDFEDLLQFISSNKINKTIHLIRFCDGKLVWHQSCGNKIDVLQKHVSDPKSQTQIPEENIFNEIEQRNEKDTFIISDSPGMGKSVLLAHLARKTRTRCPKGTFVFYFVMTDFIVSVMKHQEERGQSDKTLDDIIKQEIIRSSSNYKLDIRILTAKESQLYIFFDGLDELSSDQVELAIDCFHRIKVIFSRARLHVTTRPHLMHLLEKKLSTLGYNIDPFDEKDQIDFLTNHWSKLRYEPKLNEQKLQEFAKNCLLKLEKSLTLNEKSIAGIPLQCLLISEVFARQAEKFADPENQPIVDTVSPEIDIKSIEQLYDDLVNRKFMAFQKLIAKSKLEIDIEAALRNLHIYISIQVIMSGTDWADKLRHIFLTADAYSSIKLIRPNWEVTFLEFQAGQLPRNDILAVGILQEIDIGQWHFIHRTFAEYFIADFAAKHLTQNSDPDDNSILIRSFIEEAVFKTISFNAVLSKNLKLEQNSFKFKYPVICHFLNTKAIRETNFALEPKSNDIQEACINDNFLNLLKTLMGGVSKQEQRKWEKIILIAAQNSSIEILQWIEFNKPIFYKYYPTVLHITIEHGHKALVSYILHNCIPEELIQKTFLNSVEKNDQVVVGNVPKPTPILPDITEFLPFCLVNTTESSEDIIKNKKEIIKILHDTFRQTFLHKLYQNKPLLVPNIHIDLLCHMMEFITREELIDEKDDNDRTVLYKAAEYLPAENYQKLLTSIFNYHPNALKVLLCLHDKVGQTPLEYLICRMNVTVQTLELFSRYGAGISFCDKIGHNILWNAIRHKQSLPVIKYLLKCNKNQVDKYKRNALHIAAQHAMDDQVIENLLGHFSVDSQDCFGNTPIYYAIRNRNELSDFQLFTLLVSLKPSKLNHVNLKKQTVVEYAKKLKNEQAQEILRQLGYKSYEIK